MLVNMTIGHTHCPTIVMTAVTSIDKALGMSTIFLLQILLLSVELLNVLCSVITN